ncbi:D-aminoacyl-tRNA deacylase [Pyrobaculum calidifontis]|uniref:D-aminoacyl-tRNA deacylase n=1 Tax=Pyrobaculum calidifontis (strain DSM 21063 / JCM 11548 / VA1) TaxID=410359 RepID=DTDA_PYRCJ|nr:D-aminoacyl-tRNA deacylase [Pyrobaculum calidifontis]A3MWS2.1 RecName: Full=D-aminoacyl-tRNA deacylase; AltName: Full=D-tyrosyl-tRNA(Tyr) deacylase [Pyrobaculum calidifontis JCM 11548]ABO09089.1 conserved hypothetical protein [Pyrobaculum calidifontis JCM 11548]
MYVLVLSMGDPVSRTFLDVTGPMPLLKTVGNVEVRKYRDMPVVIHRGDPVEFGAEEVLASLGKWAIFISRHEMANPKPFLTVHTPGAWPDVSVSNPRLVSSLYRALCKVAEEPFDCAIEATHHPPNTSAVSATFLEVGSTEAEWNSRRAVGLLQAALEEAVKGGVEATPTMVIGDLHYTTVGDLVLKGDIDVGHIVPKYVEITLDVVRRAYEKHTVPIRRAILFRKNVKNPTRSEVVEFLKAKGVDVVLKG